MDGERLTEEEILGFFQLLLVGGQETTANLINNAILCFIENPDQLARLRAVPDLLPSAIEEVLRYRSPLQWVMRTPRRDRGGTRPDDPGRQTRARGDRLGQSRSPAVRRRRPVRHQRAIPIRTSPLGMACTPAWGRRWRALETAHCPDRPSGAA